MRFYRDRKVHLVTNAHRQARVHMAKQFEMLHMLSDGEIWKQIEWTDESLFPLQLGIMGRSHGLFFKYQN